MRLETENNDNKLKSGTGLPSLALHSLGAASSGYMLLAALVGRSYEQRERERLRCRSRGSLGFIRQFNLISSN